MKRVPQMIFIAMIAFFSNLAMAQTFTYPVKGKQGFSISEKTRDGLHVNYNLGQFSLRQLNYRGEDMSEISISGMVLPNIEGCPDLPVESRMLAIPQGANARLNIINAESEVVRDVNVAPALRIQAESEEPEFNYVKNRDVYEKNAFYPEQPFTIDRSSIRGVDVVAVSISPFQYNPVTKELRVYTNIELSVSFEGGNGHFGDDRLRSPYWDPILAAELMNYDQLPVIDYTARMQQWLRDDADGAEYLIITPNNDGWAEYANQLKNYRTRQGILTEVYRLDEMPASSIDEMKAWFHNAYNTWTIPPVAVLLFGDHGTDMSQFIPAETVSHPQGGSCISDNGYADPTGDNLPDMVFSRLVAANATEAQMMVSKQIEYEFSNPNMDASSYDHPVTALGWQTERWFQLCSEVVGGYWRNQGKHPVRINEIYEFPAPADIWSSASNTSTVVNYFGPNGQGYIPASPNELGGWTGGTGADVVNAVNNGTMMLQHRDHGSYQRWGQPVFSNSNVNQMTNVGKLTFVNTINCKTGTFDYSSYYDSDCLIEAFMRRTYNGQNAGAVGCLGPTETSYSFVNDTYVWGLMDQYDPDFLPNYGPYANYHGNWQPAFGNVAGKYFLQQSSWTSGSSVKVITYQMFTAHCDAFLRLYTQVPRTMEVAHTSAIVAGGSSISVSAPEGCTISIVKANLDGGWDILAVATATGSSQTVEFEPQAPPTVINIVVTGQDYLRYEDTIEVVPAAGSYMVVDSYTPNATPVNQQTSLSVNFRNVGLDATSGTTYVTINSNDDRLTIIDGIGQFGALGGNQVVSLENEFSFIIAQNVPDNTRFHLNVTMTCGEETWTGELVIKAIQAVPVYVGMSWAEMFDAGETLTLTATFKNNGHYMAANTVAHIASPSQYLTIVNETYEVGTLEANSQVECTFDVVIASDCPDTEIIPITFTLNADGNLYAEGSEVLRNTIITVVANPENGGTVAGEGKYIPGMTCTVTASSSGEYTFMYWTENGSVVSNNSSYSFTVATDRNLVANFSLPLSISVSANPMEGGTVSGTGEYDYGTTATVTATANEGYVFLRWTLNGSPVSGLSTYNFTVTSNAQYVAEFQLVSNGIAIGDAALSNYYLPSYSYYNYTLSQQIYTSDEIGTACEISSISFFNTSAQKSRTYTIYMAHTDKSTFENTNDWIPVTEADMVFTGSVTMRNNNWTTIVFNTPFSYNGTSNLALIVDDNTGYWDYSNMTCRVFNTEGSQAIRVYNDDTNYNPYDPSEYNGTLMSVKNQIILGLPYYITATANPTDYGSVSGAGAYSQGATCTLTATPNTGYYFLNWTEDGTAVSYDATYSFTVNGDRNLVANFVEGGSMCNIVFDLHDSYGDGWNGNYLVVDYGDGNSEQFTIESGSSASYTRSVETGSDIALTWIAGSYIGECSFDIKFDNGVLIYHKTGLNSSFQQELNINCAVATAPRTITAVADPIEGGTVEGAGTYESGTLVTLTAEPNVGYGFCYWSENGQQVSADASYSFLVSTDRNLVARFSLPMNITVTTNMAEGGTATGGGEYYLGNTCTLTATPNEGYLFLHWSNNGEVVSCNATYSFSVTEEAEIEAVFMLLEGALIGQGESTNQYLPSYSYYSYTLSQQIYTPDEIGETGVIRSISYFNAGGPEARSYDIYMVYTEKTAFVSNADWISVSESDLVYSGSVNMTTGYWTTIVLDTPFAYDGSSNLAIVIDDNTGSYTGAPHMACRVFNANGIQAIRVYSDGTNYDPYAPSSYSGTRYSVKNQIILGFMTSTTQTIELSAGWNWISTYLAVEDPIEMLDMLKASLGENATEIQSEDNMTEFDGSEWFGDLDEIGFENEKGYFVNVINECTVVLTGAPANVGDYEIPIHKGWNFIGFPSAVAIEVNAALADFEASEGDQIQTDYGMTEYDGEWFGDMEAFEPGFGIMYYSNSTEPKTLVFSTTAGGKSVISLKGKE